MKLAIISAGALAVGAVQPPRLELNLGTDLAAGHDGDAGWDYPDHDHTGTWYEQFADPNAPRIRQCQAKLHEEETNCAAPQCRAYDFQDSSNTECDVEYYLVNVDNTPDFTPEQKSAEEFSQGYNERSEWLIKYNAMDGAGNAAKEAVFTMVMEDKVPPGSGDCRELGSDTPSPCLFMLPYHEDDSAQTNTLESCSGGTQDKNVNMGFQIEDNYDGNVESSLVLSIIGPDNEELGPFSNTDQPTINTSVLGDYHLAYYVHDEAGMYGQEGSSNTAERHATITVQDTVPPVITVDGDGEWTEQEGGYVEHECQTAYSDAHATCVDDRDSWVAVDTLDDQILTVNSDLETNPVRIDGIGFNKITYTCNDAVELDAQDKYRMVKIIDETAPTLQITTVHNDIVDRYCSSEQGCGLHDGLTDEQWATQMSFNEHYVIEHTAGYVEDEQFIVKLEEEGQGYSCSDECGTYDEDGTFTEPETTTVMTWHNGTCNGPALAGFDYNAVGVYVLKYTCTDSHSQQTTKCRTVRSEDKFRPVLTILGRDEMTLEATTDGNYVDDGATCSDATDGEIPANVEVSGDVVKLSNIGTYLVQYNCRDAAGNQAAPLTRRVVVKQSFGALTVDTIITGMPIGELSEDKQFAMKLGASTLAELDLQSTTLQLWEWVGSDQHGSWIMRLGRRLFEGETFDREGAVKVVILAAVPDPEAADRVLTVFSDPNFADNLCETSNGFLADILDVKTAACEALTDADVCAEPIMVGTSQTYCAFVDGACTIDPEHAALIGPMDCDGFEHGGIGCANSVGCTMEGPQSITWEAGFTYEDQGVECSDELDGAICPDTAANEMCYDGDELLRGWDDSNVDVDTIGTYTVTYMARNSQGTFNYGFNADLCAYVRTVTVQDTLKPVMMLTYGDAEIARSNTNDYSSAMDDTSNPVTDIDEDLVATLISNAEMAETSPVSVNGWTIAAAASAVTGLALLAVSRKKASVAVPV
jgi:hypothetical protein